MNEMATITDRLTAWATAARDEVDEAWNALYDTLHPRPQVVDCAHLHSAFGPGCPHCTPRRNR